jgi:hypothetical protein
VISSPFVFKVLDISTGHMTEKDNETLREYEAVVPVYELKDFGWLCYVGEIDDNWPDHLFSPEFRAILKEAAELGCDYVRFDRDGREYDIPTFDW